MPSGPIKKTFVVKETEKSFQSKVLELARLLGWYAYHTHNSRRSTPGFPDLVLIRAPRVIFAELKTQKGVVSLEQKEVLAKLANCPTVESYLWRPSDWESIAKVLRAKELSEILNASR